MSVNEILEAIPNLSTEERAQVKALLDTLPSSPETQDVVSERADILRRMVERMKANPIPANAPAFTREELHERR